MMVERLLIKHSSFSNHSQGGVMIKRVGVEIAMMCFAGFLSAAAAPGLSVSVTAVDPPGGSYGSNYEVVMWIQNAAGTFIKTIAIWGGQKNSNDLPIWYAHSSGAVATDAVASATLRAGATINGPWNLTGSTGAVIPNGTYTFNVELSNHHSSVNAYTDWFVRGKIAIDGTTKTVTGADSTVNSGNTYLTNVSAVFTAPASVIIEKTPQQNTTNPLAFVTPQMFGAGTMHLKLVAPNGQVVWRKNYQTSSGQSLLVRPNDIMAATRYSGCGILVADYGRESIQRKFVQTR
jgi:hypothetical protein